MFKALLFLHVISISFSQSYLLSNYESAITASTGITIVNNNTNFTPAINLALFSTIDFFAAIAVPKNSEVIRILGVALSNELVQVTASGQKTNKRETASFGLNFLYKKRENAIIFLGFGAFYGFRPIYSGTFGFSAYSDTNIVYEFALSIGKQSNLDRIIPQGTLNIGYLFKLF